MTIDATFWVAVSFFIFFGGLVYLKVPQKVNNLLDEKIKLIKNEIDEAEKLKNESKNLLSDYENKIDASKKVIIEKTNKFHQDMDLKKKNADQKIIQLKEEALQDIKKASIKISIESVGNLIKNSIDKKKLETVYTEGLEEVKTTLKQTKI